MGDRIMGMVKQDDGWRLPDALWNQMRRYCRQVSRT